MILRETSYQFAHFNNLLRVKTYRRFIEDYGFGETSIA